MAQRRYFLPEEFVRSRDLEMTDKMVLLALQRWAFDPKGGFPSVERIAEEAAISERSAQRSLSRLAKLGLIKITPDANPTGRRIHQVWLRSETVASPRDKKPARKVELTPESLADRLRSLAAEMLGQGVEPGDAYDALYGELSTATKDMPEGRSEAFWTHCEPVIEGALADAA